MPISFPFTPGAETEEAPPAAAQPVAAPAAASAAPAPAPVPAAALPAADSLLGDLLMDIGPTQPVSAPSMAPAQPAGNIIILSLLHIFLATSLVDHLVGRFVQKAGV